MYSIHLMESIYIEDDLRICRMSYILGNGRHLYRGRFTNTSDIIYTWDGRYVYKGRFTNTSDILYTYDGDHLYCGRFTFMTDVRLTVDGFVPIPLLLFSMI